MLDFNVSTHTELAKERLLSLSQISIWLGGK